MGLELAVSHNACWGINTSLLYQTLLEQYIPFGSVDVTEKNGPLDLVGSILKRERNFSDPKVLVREAAWLLLCAWTDGMWEKMLSQSIAHTDVGVNDRMLIRANAGFWLNGDYGQKILDHLKNLSTSNNFDLAIEPLDVGHENFADYLLLVDNIRSANPWLEVGIAFDGAHIAEVCSWGKNGTGEIHPGVAEQALDTVIEAGLARRIFTVELNQINTSGHTHLPVYDDSGIIDYKLIAGRLAKVRQRTSWIKNPVRFIIEHDPRDFARIMAEHRTNGSLGRYIETLNSQF